MDAVKAILIIILLISLATIIFLIIRSFGYKEKLIKLKNTNQKIDLLGINQDFIKIIGNNIQTSKEKISEINNLIIEKYEIKYSTLVIFNGNRYVVEASNVSQKHWKGFENLHNQDIFRESIDNAIPKYITVEKGEKLPYLDSEFERAKSTIFFPLYAENICIGFWVIEGNVPHEYDNVDTAMLENVKNNLVSAVKAIKSQKILEKLNKIDRVTGLNSETYLYTDAIKTIDKYPISVVSLIKIINFDQIEEKVSKKTANDVLKEVTERIEKSLSPEYFTVKYSSNQIAVVFSGSDIEGVGSFLEDLKDNIEKARIKTSSSLKESMNGLNVAPKLNIALTTYYKETELEEILIQLATYLDNSSSNESDITCI